MSLDSVIFLAINLPASEERRENLKNQEAAAGINIQLVEAVSGETMTEAQRTMYNKRKRESMYIRHLTPNEQACVHSYRKALRTFLDGSAEYAVIMEDDVTLEPDFVEKLSYLIERIGGWKCCKLYTEPCKLYDVMPASDAAPVQPVFPKKFPWGAIGYLYTRSAAEILYDELSDFWLAADTQIAKILMRRGVPSMGVEPNVVGTLYPHNEQSDIDDGGSRVPEKIERRSPLQYLRYRLSVFESAVGKLRMRNLLKKSLYVKS